MKTGTKIGVISGALIFTMVSVFSQEENIRKFTEKYTITSNTLFELTSKYGDIEINNWDKDQIEIYAEIILRETSRQRAEQIFQHVTIRIGKSGEIISAETVFDDEFFKMVGRNNDADEKKFEIRYKIRLPVSTPVNIENKYGDLFINELASTSVIAVKYGNLKINKLRGKNKDEMVEVDMGYSNGTIESCEWLRVISKYSKLNIGNSKALIILSKYSKMNIETGTSIVSESKYDTYTIGKLANFVAEAQYSNYKFDEISNRIKLETKYTDVRVESVPAGFESIEIENGYGSMKFGIASNASYRLYGHAKYAKISFPETNRINRFQENNEQRVEGLIGTDSKNAGSVKIETSYGSIALNW